MEQTNQKTKSVQFINPDTHVVSITVIPGGVTDVTNYYVLRDTLTNLFKHRHITNNKKNVPTLVPGILKANGKRCKADVLANTVAVLDFDKIYLADKQRIENQLGDLAYVCYSTHSHLTEPNKAKLRFIIPLSREVTADEYKLIQQTFIKQIETSLNLKIDPASKTSSQAFYFPSCPESRKLHAIDAIHIGIPLNVDLALAQSKKQNYHVKKSFSEVSWQNKNFEVVLKNCSAINQLYQLVISDPNTDHFERRTLGQLLMAIKMPIENAVSIFRNYKKFQPETTREQLQSLKHPPSCRAIAANHGICDGHCNKIKLIRCGSPVAFINSQQKEATYE